jgi:hypothetical protein
LKNILFFNILLLLYRQASSQRDFYHYLMKQYLQKHLLQKLFIESFNNTKKNLIEDPSAQKIANLPDKLANLDINNLK